MHNRNHLSQLVKALFGSHSGECVSALNLQLSGGPLCVKTSLQPVCPSEEGTTKSYMGRGLDSRVGRAGFGCAVLQGTEFLPLFCGNRYYLGG